MTFAGGFGILIIVVAVVAIVGIFVLIYKAIYKNRVNRALSGTAPRTRMVEPLGFIQTVFILFSFGIGCIGLYFLTTMDTTIYNQQLALTELQIRMNSLLYSLDELEDDLAEFVNGESLVLDYETEWTDADASAETMDLSVSFTLNAMTAGAEVFLVVTDLDDFSQSTPFAVSGTTLDFTVTVSLDIDKRYGIAVLVDDGTTVTGEELGEFDLPQILEDRFHAYNNFNYQENIITVTVSNNTFGLAELGLTSVIVETYSSYENGTLLATDDITAFREAYENSMGERFAFNPGYALNQTTSEYSYKIIGIDAMGMTWEIAHLD